MRTDCEILATPGLKPSGPLRPDEPPARAWLDQFLRDVGLPPLPDGPGAPEALVSRGALVAAVVRALPRPPLGPDAIRESYLRRLKRPLPTGAPAAILPFSDAARAPDLRREAVALIRRLLDQVSGSGGAGP